MKTLRVMLASPSAATLRGLRKVMETDRRLEIVATARSGADCERIAREVTPHILVVDLHMGDADAGPLIRRLSEARLETAVLICSPDAIKGTPALEDAVSAGAFDFVLCPPEGTDLTVVGRQIMTQIFVAGFSRTKQIPKLASKAPASAAAAAHRIGGVLIDCAADRLDALRDLLTGLKPRGRPMVLALVRKPPPAAAKLARSLQWLALPLEVGVALDGNGLDGGKLYMLDQTAGDVTISRARTGGPVRLTEQPAPQATGEPGPGAAHLYEGFACTYGAKGIVVLLGLPRSDALDGLVAVRKAGGHSIIEKESPGALARVRDHYGNASIPDGVFSVQQILGLVNGVLGVKS